MGQLGHQHAKNDMWIFFQHLLGWAHHLFCWLDIKPIYYYFQKALSINTMFPSCVCKPSLSVSHLIDKVTVSSFHFWWSEIGCSFSLVENPILRLFLYNTFSCIKQVEKWDFSISVYVFAKAWSPRMLF